MNGQKQVLHTIVAISLIWILQKYSILIQKVKNKLGDLWNFQHCWVANEDNDMKLIPNCRGDSVESARPMEKKTLQKYRGFFQ